MKISLNWLKDYVTLPEDLTIDQLAYDLTMRTVEVEGYENPKDKLEGIVLGVITKVEDHPDADSLKICMTDVGRDKELQIVCGGSNVYVGQKVAVAVPGSWVRWHGEGEPVEIVNAELRGVMSEGMICGANELDLDELLPSAEEDIIDLKNFSGNPGDALANVLGIDDYVIEIDNKSMTHRPDLWGHYGIARELSAIYGTELKALPEVELDVSKKTYHVTIETDKCHAYSAYVIEGLDLAPAPFEMQVRLWECDVRPINNLVDITNYVMLATGNPTHGFDQKHVPEGILVRQANADEELELLDETLLKLHTEDVVITDGKKALALGGVMGGKQDSILESTDSMILEIASFDARYIRRTSTRHNVRTESSTRFEKNIDTARIDDAKNLALTLIQDILPNAKLVAYGEAIEAETTAVTIDVNYDYLGTRIGREITEAEVHATLEPLGFEITNATEEGFTVTAPIWRSTGDIEMPADILEEITRMIGYENFDFIAPVVTLDNYVNQVQIDLKRNLHLYFAERCGFQEVYTYPWVDSFYTKAANIDVEAWLELQDPPAPTQNKLRSSLVPGLLEAAVKNIRYRDEFKLFEQGSVFGKGAVVVSDENEVLPIQHEYLGGLLVGHEAVELFREAKGALEHMSRLNHATGISFAQNEKPTWADPQVWLNILDEQGNHIGELALVSPKTAKQASLKNHHAVIFEFDVDALEAFASRTNEFAALGQYQAVWQDLNIIVHETVTWAQIAELVEPLVSEVRFIEEYRDKYMPADQKSVLLRFWLDTSDHTLSSEEIETQSNAVLKALEDKLNAEMKA